MGASPPFSFFYLVSNHDFIFFIIMILEQTLMTRQVELYVSPFLLFVIPAKLMFLALVVHFFFLKKYLGSGTEDHGNSPPPVLFFTNFGRHVSVSARSTTRHITLSSFWHQFVSRFYDSYLVEIFYVTFLVVHLQIYVYLQSGLRLIIHKDMFFLSFFSELKGHVFLPTYQAKTVPRPTLDSLSKKKYSPKAKHFCLSFMRKTN